MGGRRSSKRDQKIGVIAPGFQRNAGAIFFSAGIDGGGAGMLVDDFEMFGVGAVDMDGKKGVVLVAAIDGVEHF
jgi:hypothetical protein